jgi:hypothetical protein
VRTVNQQRAQATIATLADPEQQRAATTGAMAWNQSEIGGQFAFAFELGGIADRSHQCGRDQRTHAFQFSQPLAAFILAEEPLDGCLVLPQPVIDELETLAAFPE